MVHFLVFFYFLQKKQVKMFQQLVTQYKTNTPQLLQLIDAYLAFVMASGIIQFVYMLLAGTYPYNAFLSGFICSVGTFVLAGIYNSFVLVYIN